MPIVRFCSACGSELAGPPPVTCDSCGVCHWRNPKPCANAIVVDGHRVLLARRAHPPWSDAWGAPGGFCEAGEHPVDTAAREVLEETGVRVDVTGYLGVWVNEYSEYTGRPGNEVINVSYYLAVPVGDDGEHLDTTLFDPAEVSELAWFEFDELPSPLAPPVTLAAVLEVARRSTLPPLLDRPPRAG